MTLTSQNKHKGSIYSSEKGWKRFHSELGIQWFRFGRISYLFNCSLVNCIHHGKIMFSQVKAIFKTITNLSILVQAKKLFQWFVYVTFMKNSWVNLIHPRCCVHRNTNILMTLNEIWNLLVTTPSALGERPLFHSTRWRWWSQCSMKFSLTKRKNKLSV